MIGARDMDGCQADTEDEEEESTETVIINVLDAEEWEGVTCVHILGITGVKVKDPRTLGEGHPCDRKSSASAQSWGLGVGHSLGSRDQCLLLPVEGSSFDRQETGKSGGRGHLGQDVLKTKEILII